MEGGAGAEAAVDGGRGAADVLQIPALRRVRVGVYGEAGRHGGAREAQRAVEAAVHDVEYGNTGRGGRGDGRRLNGARLLPYAKEASDFF